MRIPFAKISKRPTISLGLLKEAAVVERLL